MSFFHHLPLEITSTFFFTLPPKNTKLHRFFHFALFIPYYILWLITFIVQQNKIFFCGKDVFTLSYYSHCSSGCSWHDYAPVESINLHIFFRFHPNHNNGCWRRLLFLLPAGMVKFSLMAFPLALAQNYFQSDEKAANWVTSFTQRRPKHFHANGSPLWCIILDLSNLFFLFWWLENRPLNTSGTTKWGQTSDQCSLPILHKQAKHRHNFLRIPILKYYSTAHRKIAH